ncbi:hypothetical protein COEREDRAFT_12340, partial [Coemansia reversa NRRL 1564]
MENEKHAKRARISDSLEMQQCNAQTPPPAQFGSAELLRFSSSPSRVRGAGVSLNAKFEEIWDEKATCNVDKTLACKPFWDECNGVGRLCLPRRCGKTYNLDVLRLFFSSGLDCEYVKNVPVVTEGPEVEVDANASIKDIYRAKKRRLFKGTLLEQLHPEFFERHFAKYPVLHFNFKGVKGINLNDFLFSLFSGLDCEYVKNVPVVTEGPEVEVDANASIKDIYRAKKRRLFKGTLLEQLHPEFFERHFAKYPVLHFNFKGVKGINLNDFLFSLLSALLETAAELLSELQMSGEVDNPIIAEDMAYFRKYIEKEKSELLANITPDDLFDRLSRIVSELRCEKYILLVDEYDAPIIHIHRSNWDAQTKETALNYIQMLYSAMVKDNKKLCKGLMTGVFKVSLVDLGSGANSMEDFVSVRRRPMFVDSSTNMTNMDAAAAITDASISPTFA